MNDILHNYFLLSSASGELLAKTYDSTLVGLSVVVAIFAAYTAIILLYQMRTAYAAGNGTYYYWLGASVALGGGIFSMHFLGMLAFSLPVPTVYDLGMTLLSLLISMSVSAVALFQLRQRELNRMRVAVGAVLMGVGVSAMHYVGMASLLAPALLRYLPSLWILSVVVAIGVSLVAIILLHYFSLKQGRYVTLTKLLVAGLMGIAVALMHYTGMAAAQFYSGGACGVDTGLFNSLKLDNEQLGFEVAAITIVLILVGVVASLLNDRIMQALREKNDELEEVLQARTLELKKQYLELSQRDQAINEHAIVSTTDQYGAIISANDKFCEISGYQREELIGKNHRILKSGEHPPTFYRELWQTIAQGKVWHGEVKNLKKDGGYYWVKATILPYRELDGTISRYVSIRTDITEQKDLEQQLKQKHAALEQTTYAKDNFFATMSHELRTPLTSIIGNSEHLLDSGVCGNGTCPHKDAEEVLRSIHSAGESQLALVNDILDMSKIESGKFTIDDTPYDLNQLISDIARMFKVKAQDAGLELVIDLQQREENLLKGDAQRIGQVLINLLGNAIKFTDQGSVTLTTWSDQKNLCFRVSDTGIGMSEETQERLFSRFSQADSSISRRFGGSGLGLYISYNLVQLMGGTLQVSSRERTGSSFLVTLPYRVTTTPVQQPTESTPLNRKFSGRVLVAEDTPELQLLERRILEGLGLSVSIANDGEEAVALATAEPIDIILMDMQMPNMDGIEATTALRAMGVDTPVIALTANVMQKHRDAFHEAGCNEFISKPIDKQELIRVLDSYLIQPQQTVVPSVADEMVDEEMMAIFLESRSKDDAELEQALSVEDWAGVRKVAHTVKGSAISFGYPALSKLAESVQLAIDESREESEIRSLAVDLLSEIKALLNR